MEKFKKVLGALILFNALFLIASCSSEEDSGTDDVEKVSIEGKFEDDSALKDYLVSKGEMQFSCSRYGFTASLKFVDHTNVEVSLVGEMQGVDDKFTTEYVIEDWSYWETVGMEKRFRRAVKLKQGGLLGEEKAAVQFICSSSDPHSDSPSFEGQIVRLEDGCSGLGL